MTVLNLVFCRVLALLTLAVLCAIPPAAVAEETAARWRVDFGPYAGWYDFDPLTKFEDGFMGGLRLGLHRDSWFRLEAEFDEVYTSREPVGNAARQITLGAHFRVEPQWWRLAPSAFAGLGFVMFDDSENPDSFAEGYDLGAGLALRVSDAWRLRADFLARYQQFRVRDPELPGDDPEALGDPVGAWAAAWRVGAFYDLPDERDGEVVEYPIELGVYAGYWNFDSVFRYEDDAVLGLRGSIGLFDWLALELELDQITTSNQRTDAWSQAITFAIHGLVEPFDTGRWEPGLLAGVAFMGLDNRLDFDTVAEGFDIGPSLRLRTGDRLSVRADVPLRYQSVRLYDLDEGGGFRSDARVEYVWSFGARLGVSFGL